MNKKESERKILNDFIKASKWGIDVLDTSAAQQLFPRYDEENPDFIVCFQGEHIGIELSEMCLTESPITWGGKTFKNLKHKGNKEDGFSDTFETLEALQEYFKKWNPETCPPKEQDNITSILEERIREKSMKINRYVTRDNWFLFYNVIGDQDGMVADVFDDRIEEKMKGIIKGLVAKYDITQRTKRVILFEPYNETEQYLDVEITVPSES